MNESANQARALADIPVAFSEGDDVVVNFGTLTGREATQAEIDRLANLLHKAGAGPDITITATRRQEYADGIETVVHQVRVVAAGGDAPRMEAVCREWVLECAEDRSVEPLS